MVMTLFVRVIFMETNTFERKIELNTPESIKKLADIMKLEAPVKPLSTHPFSTTERDGSEKLLKQ